MWRRAPLFYAGKLCERALGINDSWLTKNRDDFAPGTWQWLALSELQYGGFKVGVASRQNRGGDRMSPFFHRYGITYQEFLKTVMPRRGEGLTLVEIGILNGSGLAIWCDLFPKARVIGLDIDLRNFEANRASLEAAGAFSENRPELHEFNQLDPSKAAVLIRKILGETKVDIAIDDGCHSIESIEITFRAMLPHMAPQFVYFIEDNFDTYDVLAGRHRELRWAQRGEMTVATNRVSS
jgi:hypothetical protein